MTVEHVTAIDDPRLSDYRNVPDPVLLRERGVFIAEGRHVVRLLLAARARALRSVLVSPAAFEALGPELGTWPGLTVFVAPHTLMEGIVGFDVHRGCLAAGGRPSALSVVDVLTAAESSAFIAVIDGVANADNIGAIFRNARAFGAGGVLLSPGCCDPLYRKAIRVSIGATVVVPFASVEDWPRGLHAVRERGYQLATLTVRGDTVELEEYARTLPRRVAWVLGHEGHGVSPGAEALADVAVRIGLEPGADSINVAAAAGIAMYFTRRRSAGFRPVSRHAGVD